MRLTDPRFGAGFILPPQWASQADPLYIGVRLRCQCLKCTGPACPTCGHKDRGQVFIVHFWPFIDDKKIIERFQFDGESLRKSWAPTYFNRLSGTTLEDLTLDPSIQYQTHGVHFSIKDGEVLGMAAD